MNIVLNEQLKYMKKKYHSRQKKIQEELLQQKEDERRSNYLSSLHKIDDNYKNNRIVNN